MPPFHISELIFEKRYNISLLHLFDAWAVTAANGRQIQNRAAAFLGRLASMLFKLFWISIAPQPSTPLAISSKDAQPLIGCLSLQDVTVYFCLTVDMRSFIVAS
jgi:hypothetical protein